MAEKLLYRIKVRSAMVMPPSMLNVNVLPLTPPSPGVVRLGPHVPTLIPLELVPLDLQQMGQCYWMVFDERREVIGVERLDGDPQPDCG